MTTLDWLLDSDPALRWQVLRDLTDTPDAEITAERARVATEGWGARLLALQGADGQWDGGTYRPGWVDDEADFFDAWTATTYSLLLLRDLGLDPLSPEARQAVALVRENSRWDYNGEPFFSGEVEPCINGMAVAIGSYFGEDVDGIVDRLLASQLQDGGWNCWAEYGATVASFSSTIAVLDGLLEYENAGGRTPVAAARRRAEEYLLERHLFKRLSTGEIVEPTFLQFSFPTRWFYDVLRALDYLRATGAAPDPRAADAIALVESKRDADGRWPLENTHEGPVHFDLEDGDGNPSRWNTLRALRVLEWWNSAA